MTTIKAEKGFFAGDSRVKTQLAAKQVELNDLFKELHAVTNDFAIPNDVCETFEGTYQLLEETESILIHEMTAVSYALN